MKLIVTAVIALLALPTFARELLVDGVGVVSVPSDIADLQFEVEERGPLDDALTVKNKAEIKVNNFLAALAEIGVTDVKASTVSMNADTDRDPVTRARTKYWVVERPIFVSLTDLDKLDDVLRLSLEHDIEGPRGISYRSSRYNEALLKARELAVEDSKAKAKALAQQYDACLGAVQSIEAGGTRRTSNRRNQGQTVVLSALSGDTVRQDPPVYVPGSYDPEATRACTPSAPVGQNDLPPRYRTPS